MAQKGSGPVLAMVRIPAEVEGWVKAACEYSGGHPEATLVELEQKLFASLDMARKDLNPLSEVIWPRLR